MCEGKDRLPWRGAGQLSWSVGCNREEELGIWVSKVAGRVDCSREEELGIWASKVEGGWIAAGRRNSGSGRLRLRICWWQPKGGAPKIRMLNIDGQAYSC